MQFNAYQIEAAKTCAVQGERDMLMLGCLGLAGETGEFVDPCKKHFFHGKKLDRMALALELGDILWYIAIAAKALGFTFNEIAQLNIGKLQYRAIEDPNHYGVDNSNPSSSV